MAQQLYFGGNHPEIKKAMENKLGIYPIKTSSYGHIQHEKNLPIGTFFRGIWSSGNDDFSTGSHMTRMGNFICFNDKFT